MEWKRDGIKETISLYPCWICIILYLKISSLSTVLSTSTLWASAYPAPHLSNCRCSLPLWPQWHQSGYVHSEHTSSMSEILHYFKHKDKFRDYIKKHPCIPTKNFKNIKIVASCVWLTVRSPFCILYRSDSSLCLSRGNHYLWNWCVAYLSIFLCFLHVSINNMARCF